MADNESGDGRGGMTAEHQYRLRMAALILEAVVIVALLSFLTLGIYLRGGEPLAYPAQIVKLLTLLLVIFTVVAIMITAPPKTGDKTITALVAILSAVVTLALTEIGSV